MAFVFILYLLISDKVGWGIFWYDWVILGAMFIVTLFTMYYKHRQAVLMNEKVREEMAAIMFAEPVVMTDPDDFSRIEDEDSKDKA